ncbi:MAG: GGDEF domain-containing protein [Candidatus Melainabacteria bacterium]|nr:GGDEF domain-containing protein [Candidatus Melainabacteria bacterium]
MSDATHAKIRRPSGEFWFIRLHAAALLLQLVVLHPSLLAYPVHPAAWTLSLALGLLHCVVSEWAIRRAGLHTQEPDAFVAWGMSMQAQKQVAFWAISATVAVSLCYGLNLGAVGLLLLLTGPLLATHLFGLGRLGIVLAGWNVSLLLVGGLLGWPILPQTGFAATLCLLPGILVLLHWGWLLQGQVKNVRGQMTRLQSLASTDGLTGLINRRQFNQRLIGEISRARRHQTALSLALFDIDNFKKLNDFYGHPTGDRILRELGSLLAQNVRESDVAARYGGEEFALILPETRQMEAFDLLERLRGLIEKTVFCLPDNPLTLTVSVGITQLDFRQDTSFEFVERADSALYEAKRYGKNVVIVHGVSASTLPVRLPPSRTAAKLPSEGLITPSAQPVAPLPPEESPDDDPWQPPVV